MKTSNRKIIWPISVISILWVIFLMISLWWIIKEGRGNFSDFLFHAISTLFSGIALVVASLSIYFQSKNSQKQIDVNIFTETIREIIDSDRFYESRVYLFSNEYYRDLNQLKRELGKEKFNLNDIRNLCYKNICVNPKTQEKLRKSYEKIIYFCSKMEYLGVICKKEVAANIIIDYYGITIVQSYERLKCIIDNEDDDLNSMYSHYVYLYKSAKLREMIFIELSKILKEDK